jgi:hypothetical protein
MEIMAPQLASLNQALRKMSCKQSRSEKLSNTCENSEIFLKTFACQTSFDRSFQANVQGTAMRECPIEKTKILQSISTSLFTLFRITQIKDE